jgi:hypothetical protein
MKEYEFAGVDVLNEMQKFMREMSNEKRKFINEDIVQDKKYVETFISAVLTDSINENQLIIGNYYCPMLIQVDYKKKLVGVMIAIKLAQYIGSTGSRLRFMYDECQKPLFFPSDEGLIPNSVRAVFPNRDKLDFYVNLLVLKFNYDDWIIKAQGFDEMGDLRPISNI